MAFVTTRTAESLAWAKIKFYWSHYLSGLTASSTASGTDVDNLLNRLEINKWQATTNAAQTITFDAGAGNTITADYLAISGHNLYSTGAALALEYSNDNFSADVNDAFTPYVPTSDREIVKEFSSVAERYWRISLGAIGSGAVEMALAYWGELTELDYCSTGFGPNDFEDNAIVNLSEAGYVTGVHNRYKERSFTLNFGDQNAAFYAKVKAWSEAIGKENFFMAWESLQHADDVYLVRSDGKFKAPLVKQGLYRDISINILGRMQE